jgi:hemerythrin-like metal-binding protein
MEFVTWNSQYSVGVSEIDTQHKELMNILNDLIYHSNRNKNDEKIYFDKIKDMAEEYIIKHFETEENILSKTNYERLEEHKLEHKNFLKEIKRIIEEIDNDKSKMTLSNIAEWIKEWLLNHIKTYDKDGMEYFKDGIKKK